MLELRAAKFATLTFSKGKNNLAVQPQMDNQTALAYLIKMEGAKNLILNQETKKIWKFCMSQQISLTAEYLPGVKNTKVDQASSEVKKSSSGWILDKGVFQKIVKLLGQVDTDLFASRLCQQFPRSVIWQPDPRAGMVDAFLLNWKNLQPYAFPPFALICWVLAKVIQKKCGMILVTPVWSLQVWYTTTETGSSRRSVDSTFSISYCEPRRVATSTMSKLDTKPTNMKNINIRQGISAQGLSSQTVAWLESSRRSGTQKHYKACWWKFSGSCQSREINPVFATSECVSWIKF